MSVEGLGPRGRALHEKVSGAYELSAAEADLLAEACRTVDALEDLQAAVARDGVVVEGPAGAVRTHPALVELRQQRVTLSRLVASLRLPDEEGNTPSHRRAAVGAYRPRPVHVAEWPA